MLNFLSKLSDEETDRIGLKSLAVLYTVAIPALLYILAIARYGAVVTNLALAILVASFLPEAHAIWKESKRMPDSEPEEGDREDDTIIAKHHWMMLAWPTTVLALSLFALGFHAFVVSGDLLKLGYTGSMVIAFGLMVGIPYFVTAMRFYRSYRQIPRSTLAMRVAGLTGLLIFVTLICYVLQDKGVSFDWLRSLSSFLGGLAIDLFRMITASQSSVLWTIVVLAAAKLLVQFIDWQINPLELDGNLFTERSGIVRREPRSVRVSEITDLKAAQFKLNNQWKFPWLRLTVETAGQDQALTNIHWVPQEMYEELMICWNQEKGA